MPDNPDLARNYYELTEQLTDAVEDWLRTLKDPYKPPELKTGLDPTVSNLCFKQCAYWYALQNLQ